MPAKKKPTMLQRQRALRKQQQQTKQQSSKQLPPKGQSSADSRQARGQRTTTAKAQAANQQRVIARGMEGFIRRGKAQDKLDAAAKGTQGSGTRTAGAGGGLAKRQSSAVNQSTSGKPTTQGGRVTPSASGQASSNRVQQVRVRDLGSTKPKTMSGGTPRALPPGKQGGQLARVARTAASTAGKVGAAGKVLPVAGTLLTAAGEVRAMVDRQKRWDDYKKRTGLDKKTEAQTGGSRRGAAAGTRAKPTSALQGRVGNANVNDLRRGQEEARKAQLERANRGQRNTTQSGGGSTQSRSGGGTSRPSSPARQSTPAMPKKPFTGTVSEGRKMWAEKYSSSKYDGQAIQKEAKALLKKIKEEKNNESAAKRAGWDGNKNY
jgi:hypothetical protein